MNALDRRHDRRKQLPADFCVELHPQELTDGGPTLVGRGIDLTMGGIGVVLADKLEDALHGEIWAVTFALPDKSGRSHALTLNALITHGRPHPDGQLYGFRFNEIGAPSRSGERAALRQFLLSDLRDRWQGNLALHAPSVSV